MGGKKNPYPREEDVGGEFFASAKGSVLKKDPREEKAVAVPGSGIAFSFPNKSFITASQEEDHAPITIPAPAVVDGVVVQIDSEEIAGENLPQEPQDDETAVSPGPPLPATESPEDVLDHRFPLARKPRESAPLVQKTQKHYSPFNIVSLQNHSRFCTCALCANEKTPSGSEDIVFHDDEGPGRVAPNMMVVAANTPVLPASTQPPGPVGVGSLGGQRRRHSRLERGVYLYSHEPRSECEDGEDSDVLLDARELREKFDRQQQDIEDRLRKEAEARAEEEKIRQAEEEEKSRETAIKAQKFLEQMEKIAQEERKKNPSSARNDDGTAGGTGATTTYYGYRLPDSRELIKPFEPAVARGAAEAVEQELANMGTIHKLDRYPALKVTGGADGGGVGPRSMTGRGKAVPLGSFPTDSSTSENETRAAKLEHRRSRSPLPQRGPREAAAVGFFMSSGNSWGGGGKCWEFCRGSCYLLHILTIVFSLKTDGWWLVV